MTIEELLDILNKADIPWAHLFWDKPPAPPYGVYYASGTDNFAADNIAYYENEGYTLELYTYQRDRGLEQKLEKALTDAGVYWERLSPAYVNTLRQIQTTYNIMR